VADAGGHAPIVSEETLDFFDLTRGLDNQKVHIFLASASQLRALKYL
jgi:hypothetical protein